MVLPHLTPEERQAALEKAAVARKKRAAIKADLKSGNKKLSEVLELAKEDAVLAKLKVTSLLQSLPGVGPAKCEAIMEDAKISPSRRLAGLGKHQAERLIELFG
ncbi:integration host factor, actinobacterial type [Trueperella abortisuis]|uniref:DNA uptake protein ComE-like DNA-binding protein n=1 Tax=Trueperella abortisuis TaxID=445930 RepID=A0ABT9PKA0_9ACTO|nr:integration host factor, actinobacterial type [Trueperella abortisuis]MDP9832370.1 DNA uptake protein ComE-like DNA-binding protein [Trueperella abortisuis]